MGFEVYKLGITSYDPSDAIIGTAAIAIDNNFITIADLIESILDSGGGSSAGSAGAVQLSDGSGGFEAGTVPLTVDPTSGAISTNGVVTFGCTSLSLSAGGRITAGGATDDGTTAMQVAGSIKFYGADALGSNLVSATGQDLYIGYPSTPIAAGAAIRITEFGPLYLGYPGSLITLNGPALISVDSSSPALTLTQTGTGPCITMPNSQFDVDGNLRVQSGQTFQLISSTSGVCLELNNSYITFPQNITVNAGITLNGGMVVAGNYLPLFLQGSTTNNQPIVIGDSSTSESGSVIELAQDVIVRSGNTFTVNGAIASGVTNVGTVSSGSYITDATAGNEVRLTLGAATTLAAPTGAVDGQGIAWLITQDTNGWALTLASGTGGFITSSDDATEISDFTTPNQMAYLTAVYNAGLTSWVVSGFKRFF